MLCNHYDSSRNRRSYYSRWTISPFWCVSSQVSNHKAKYNKCGSTNIKCGYGLKTETVKKMCFLLHINYSSCFLCPFWVIAAKFTDKNTFYYYHHNRSSVTKTKQSCIQVQFWWWVLIMSKEEGTQLDFQKSRINRFFLSVCYKSEKRKQNGTQRCVRVKEQTPFKCSIFLYKT